jgi:hypothetical protein
MTAVEIFAAALFYAVPIALLAMLFGERFATRGAGLALVLLALPAFYVGHYFLVKHLQGWPSNNPLPDEFRLLGFEVREPGANGSGNGEILLWVAAAGADRPRVHRVGYRRQLHESLIAAAERQARGHPQTGHRTDTRSAASAGSVDATLTEIRFRDADIGRLPAKEGG